MTQIERFQAVDRCLYWKEKKILIVGDLHLGYEDYLAESGWSFPKTQLQDTLSIFEKIFNETGKLKEIVLLGDVKHYFAGVLNEEFSDFKKVIELFNKNLLSGGKIVIVKGNHDNILEPIIQRWGYDGIKVVPSYSVDDVLMFHGDKDFWEKIEVYDKKNKLLIVGHFHPAVSIRESAKKEVYKCFLFGKFKDKKVIVVPSFFTLVEGTDVSVRKLDGWFDVSKYELFVVADKVYEFGKVRALE